MGLNRIRLGDLIEPCNGGNENGCYGADDVFGISVDKTFIKTKADLNGVSLSNYIVVEPKWFAFVMVTSRNGGKISIAFNDGDSALLVFSFNAAFRLSAYGKTKLLEEYLFMYLNRTEFDRYARMNSWGSARERFYLSDMADVSIPLPPIEVQRKYVAIYEAMQANQRIYEKGLDDLKLTCDALLDHCKKSKTWEPVGKHLREVDVRNASGKCDVAYGINIKKEFMLSKASSDDLLKYKLVEPGQLAYSAMQTGRDKCIRIALNESSSALAVSPAYSILESVDAGVDARYVMMWFSRAESDRYGWFLSDASIRANLDLSSFLEIEMPIPESGLRETLCDLYSVLRIRSNVNDRLKSQLKDICPILIRGSIEEASR